MGRRQGDRNECEDDPQARKRQKAAVGFAQIIPMGSIHERTEYVDSLEMSRRKWGIGHLALAHWQDFVRAWNRR
jgi:hypothetical protein